MSDRGSDSAKAVESSVWQERRPASSATILSPVTSDEAGHASIVDAEDPDADEPRLPSVDQPDAVIVARAAGGDREAVRDIVDRYRRLVYSVAWKISGDPDDADDIAQEAFVRIMRGLSGYRREAGLSSWIFRVTVSAALDDRRRRERRPAPVEPASGWPRVVPGAEVTYEQLEDCRTVLEAMGRLTPAQRGPLVLREVYGLPYAEIGELLGRPVGTVKAAVHRGRSALRDALDEVGRRT